MLDMNHTITLTPRLNVPAPERVERKTISSALAVRFATWLEKAPTHTLLKTLIRFSIVVLIASFIFARERTIALLIALAMWNSYKIPIFIALVVFTLNLKRLYLMTKRVKIRQRSKGNQHTLCGVSVPELADFLIENKSFKFEDVTSKLAMPQRQYAKLAELLEHNQILIRGEKHARILNEISRTMLVEQLRALAENKATPFVWSQERTCWAERNGAFETWAMNHDFKQRKLTEDIEKKERKLERIEKKIGQSAAFADLFSKTA